MVFLGGLLTLKFYTSMSIVFVKMTKSLNMIYEDSVADQKERKEKEKTGLAEALKRLCSRL